MKLTVEVSESHSQLWTRDDWRIAILMGGRGNGRSGTASRYVVSQLVSKEYVRGAVMRAVREDIRPSCWQEIIDRLEEQNASQSFRVVDILDEVLYGWRLTNEQLATHLKLLKACPIVADSAEPKSIGERTLCRLHNAFTGAFHALDPLPQYRAASSLGEYFGTVQ